MPYRKCLVCNNEFEPESRFNFVCKKCRMRLRNIYCPLSFSVRNSKVKNEIQVDEYYSIMNDEDISIPYYCSTK